MIVKIFRAVWFISLLIVTAVLFYGYATLPENVIVSENGTNIYDITRDMFFYIVLGFLSVINVMVVTIARIGVKNEAFKTWFYGLIITFNIFFIVAISFISLYNSGETYDYKRLETIIYTSIGLFSFWTVGWPVYIGYKRFSGKS